VIKTKFHLEITRAAESS